MADVDKNIEQKLNSSPISLYTLHKTKTNGGGETKNKPHPTHQRLGTWGERYLNRDEPNKQEINIMC